MSEVFSDTAFSVRQADHCHLDSTLLVYQQCEDFLSLGLVPKASLAMVLADLDQSAQAKGVYCGIWNCDSVQVGVLDFIPEVAPRTAFLSLLMIAKPYRSIGLGTMVLVALERHLTRSYGICVLESGVQVNNATAIAFWQHRGFCIDDTARALPDGTTVFTISKDIRDIAKPNNGMQRTGCAGR